MCRRSTVCGDRHARMITSHHGVTLTARTTRSRDPVSPPQRHGGAVRTPDQDDLRPDVVLHRHDGTVRGRHDRGLTTLCINTIRALAIDAVEAARSGHPGTPM